MGKNPAEAMAEGFCAMTRDELTFKCKAVMVEHLKAKGYPNLTTQQILNERKPMWIALEEAHLIQPGMNYRAFSEISEREAAGEGSVMDEMIDRILQGMPS